MYSFCPKCGAKLTTKKVHSEEKPRLVCTNDKCGYIFYLNPAPTVSGLIEKDNQILLVKRAIDPFKGDWDTPGGFVEMGETFEQGLSRELKEEINQDIVSTQYFGSGITPYVNGPDKTLGQNLCVFYLCQTKGKIKPGDDVADAKFFSWDKLPDNIADFADVKQMLYKRQRQVLGKNESRIKNKV